MGGVTAEDAQVLSLEARLVPPRVEPPSDYLGKKRDFCKDKPLRGLRPLPALPPGSEVSLVQARPGSAAHPPPGTPGQGPLGQDPLPVHSEASDQAGSAQLGAASSRLIGSLGGGRAKCPGERQIGERRRRRSGKGGIVGWKIYWVSPGGLWT